MLRGPIFLFKPFRGAKNHKHKGPADATMQGDLLMKVKYKRLDQEVLLRMIAII